MLISPKKLLFTAQKNGYAVGAFNACNLEIAQAIIWAAEAKKAAVTLQVTETSLEYAGFNPLVSMLKTLIEETEILIDLHLDHGKNFDTIARCIESGFTSVQIDGSKLSFDENVELTKKVVKFAHKKGVFVQGELDKTPGSHCVSTSLDDIAKFGFTDPIQAKDFVDKTGVDSFAVSIGNAHGFGDTKLNFEVLKQVRNVLNIPLVMHGGSGIPKDLIRQAIKLGISAINIDSEIGAVFTDAIKKYFKKPVENPDPRKYLELARDAAQRVVEEKIKWFRME